ncbi:MAG: DUF1080 domain-containing protein [Planctomycetes bacterium]|jgi:hypothetical protein|nr:DUF1080 domain-containing protein [Planctomycetota bacterium]
MYGVKLVLVFLVFSLMLCASSCHRSSQGAVRIRTRSPEANLLATGLIGWQQIGGREEAWRFEDGVLYAEGENAGWLATARQYEDFALSVEFRIPPGGNSGIFLRTPLEGNPAYAGVEIQIVDDYAEQWRDLEPEQYAGSIYGVQAPAEHVSQKPGEWQQMVIVARGSRLKVGLNGEKIIDTDLTYYPDQFQTHPGLTRTGGYIGLQSQGGRVEFRNMTIRELPREDM